MSVYIQSSELTSEFRHMEPAIYLCLGNQSSLNCNTSARHEQHECNTSATQVRHEGHEQHECYTTRVRHECYTNDTSATRVKKVNQVKGFRVLMVRFSITSALLLATSFVSSAQSVKQQSPYSKKSSHKKMLNKRGPKKEPCGTPDLIFSHIL